MLQYIAIHITCDFEAMHKYVVRFARWQEMLLKFTQSSRPAKPRTVSLPAGIALKDLPPPIQVSDYPIILLE